MFLNPVVPGSLVYLFEGIIICRRAQASQSVSYALGVVVCCAMCFVMKMQAVAMQQLCIGVPLGSWVSVQKLVGVDKVFTRGIEYILKKPGLFPGKVAILCGAPDWPVSVLTGILRLSVWQMLLGTTPIIFVIVPTALAGAFMIQTGGIWDTIGGIAIMAGLAVQGGSMAIATYYVNEITATDDPDVQEELRRSRPEHAAVVELTKQTQALNDAYFAATQWSAMPLGQQLAIAVSATLSIVIPGLIHFFPSRLFRKIDLTSRIDHSYDAIPPGLCEPHPDAGIRSCAPSSGPRICARRTAS